MDMNVSLNNIIKNKHHHKIDNFEINGDLLKLVHKNLASSKQSISSSKFSVLKVFMKLFLYWFLFYFYYFIIFYRLMMVHFNDFPFLFILCRIILLKAVSMLFFSFPALKKGKLYFIYRLGAADAYLIFCFDNRLSSAFSTIPFSLSSFPNWQTVYPCLSSLRYKVRLRCWGNYSCKRKHPFFLMESRDIFYIFSRYSDNLPSDLLTEGSFTQGFFFKETFFWWSRAKNLGIYFFYFFLCNMGWNYK